MDGETSEEHSRHTRRELGTGPDRIDRGETGDKQAVEDPAVAPLGTDAQAGGSSTGGKCRRALVALALAAMAAASVIIAVALTLAP